MQLSSGFKRYFVNTSWLFFERIIGMAVTFFVGVYVARYLGPANFGLLSYAGSFVGLFSAIAALGLDNIVVRELVKDEKRRDELLGTTFVLKVIGSIFVLTIIAIAVRFTNNDSFTNLLIFIIAIGTIFQSFNVINFYFQAKVLSKYTVYAQVFTTILCAAIKLLLIYFNMGLIYFTIVTLLQSIILASGLIVMYTKQKSSLLKWSINYGLAKNLLKDSWPLILSGIAISIYMKIDQVMIKNMLNTEAVGNYAVAVRISEVWYFIPMAITKSVFPAIINAKKISEKLYYERLQKLYDLMVWLAIGIALPIMLLSNNIIKLLFGIQYQEAAGVLRIYVWAGVFVFLGVASSQYLIAENYTKISFLNSLTGAIVNVILNITLIPKFGIKGAAIATVISYFVSVFLIILIPKTYKNSVLMLKSFSPLSCIKRI
ncbi:MAG TPA: flippase [Candidatus Atribacteria bacterium]|nr:flippase [Candidatus Atribacteria bacterium]